MERVNINTLAYSFLDQNVYENGGKEIFRTHLKHVGAKALANDNKDEAKLYAPAFEVLRGIQAILKKHKVNLD